MLTESWIAFHKTDVAYRLIKIHKCGYFFFFLPKLPLSWDAYEICYLVFRLICAVKLHKKVKTAREHNSQRKTYILQTKVYAMHQIVPTSWQVHCHMANAEEHWRKKSPCHSLDSWGKNNNNSNTFSSIWQYGFKKWAYLRQCFNGSGRMGLFLLSGIWAKQLISTHPFKVLA